MGVGGREREREREKYGLTFDPKLQLVVIIWNIKYGDCTETRKAPKD